LSASHRPLKKRQGFEAQPIAIRAAMLDGFAKTQ